MADNNTTTRPISRAEALCVATHRAIKSFLGADAYLPYDVVNDPDKAVALGSQVDAEIQLTIETENVMRNKGAKWKPQTDLTAQQIGDTLLATGLYCCYKDTSGNRMLLMAQVDGVDAGVWLPQKSGSGTTSDPSAETARLVRNIVPHADTLTVNQTIQYIRTSAPLVEINKDTGLIFTNSGIVDIRPPRTQPDYIRYDDDTYTTTYGYKSEKPIVRLWKVRTEYNPNATLPVIATPDGNWNPIEMIRSWYDIDRYTDHEKDLLVKAILTMINGAVRGTSFKRLVMLADSNNSVVGGGGKSSLLDLIACILSGTPDGGGMIMNTPIENLDDQFALADLPHTAAILSHESDGAVKGIEKQNNIKKLVTGEPVCVEQKFQSPVNLSWNGLVVQAFNEFPPFKSKGGALLSGRAIGLRHERDFRKLYKTERKYIKDDLIRRPVVREYLLNEAIKLGCIGDYDVDILNLLKRNMSEVREQNTKTWIFLSDIMPLLHDWRNSLEALVPQMVKENSYDVSYFKFRIPIALLYGCYKLWSKKYDNDRPAGLKSFTADLAGWVAEHTDWKMIDRDKSMTVPGCMTWYWTDEKGAVQPNPLLWQYPLDDDFRDINYDYNTDTANAKRYKYRPRSKNYRGNLEYVG